MESACTMLSTHAPWISSLATPGSATHLQLRTLHDRIESGYGAAGRWVVRRRDFVSFAMAPLAQVGNLGVVVPIGVRLALLHVIALLPAGLHHHHASHGALDRKPEAGPGIDDSEPAADHSDAGPDGSDLAAPRAHARRGEGDGIEDAFSCQAIPNREDPAAIGPLNRILQASNLVIGARLRHGHRVGSGKSHPG